MSLWRLIAREILYRKLNFALGVVSVLAAVGCLVAALSLLRTHDLRTDELLADKETRLKDDMARLENDYRKLMKQLGFNVFILPKDQDRADVFAEGFAKKTMPEAYVDKLARSKIMTVRHLLPILEQRIKWPERERAIVLVGTRGEVPFMHRSPKEPMLDLVPRGTLVLGYELHRSLGLAVGHKVKLLGREFTIQKCKAERSTKDDITIWVNLAEAQELLDMKGSINGIMALDCVCAQARPETIRAEIQSVLPDTQLVFYRSKALVRYEARRKLAESNKATLETERTNRNILRERRLGFAGVLVPVVIVGAVVSIGFLAFANVRERRPEIGVLRALGVASSKVFLIFLVKAILFGVCGAAIGYIGGLAAGWRLGASLGELPESLGSMADLIDPMALGGVLVLAPLLAALASWIPAMMAARQDPAVVLRDS